jgi:hypothetical protein
MDLTHIRYLEAGCRILQAWKCITAVSIGPEVGIILPQKVFNFYFKHGTTDSVQVEADLNSVILHFSNLFLF